MAEDKSADEARPSSFSFYRHLAALKLVAAWYVFTHAFPHLDEIAAVWMARFCKERFPGIGADNAGFAYDGDEEIDWRKVGRAGGICVGVGANAPCNEHQSHNSRGAEGKCASTLFAEGLGLPRTDLVLWKILDRINENDVYGKSGSALSLPGMIMMLYDNNVQQRDVIIWGAQALDALYEARTRALPKEKSPVGFDRLVAEWIARRRTDLNGPAVWEEIKGESPECFTLEVMAKLNLSEDGAFNLIAETVLYYTEKKQGATILDLRNVVDEMKALGQSEQEIKAWLYLGLDAVYADGIRFQQAVAMVRSDTAVVRARATGKVFDINIIAAKTDNNKFGRAARMSGLLDAHGEVMPSADVVVQMQPSGNAQVFFNKKTLYGADFAEVERRLRGVIRTQEALANDRSYQQPWMAPLDCPGRHPAAPEWYVHATGFLNGARSAPGVPPTKLTLLKLMQIVATVFKSYEKSGPRGNTPPRPSPRPHGKPVHTKPAVAPKAEQPKAPPPAPKPTNCG